MEKIKKLIRIVFCAILLFAICYEPPGASAHLLGQPPFFKVNGIYSPFYNVPSTSLDNFALPQDAGPTHYLVDKPLDFELVISQLPVPQSIVKKTNFEWDFGDGSHGTGLINVHTYKKMGSYMLSITASYTDNGVTVPPQLLETIMLQILPNQHYKLPQSVILINGNYVKNPLKDILHFEPNIPIQLDGSRSNAQSSKIVRYFWDLGDSTTSEQKELTHIYSQNYQLLNPMLRVRDANGFIVDSYVQMSTKGGLSTTNASSPQEQKGFPWTVVVGGFIIFAAFIGTIILLKPSGKGK